MSFFKKKKKKKGRDADFDNKKCNKQINPVTLAQIETYIHIYLWKK